MPTRVIYPGTFDPITNGHTDIIKRAASVFDHIIVAVAGSTSKSTVFSTDERVALAEKVLTGCENVEVCRFGGLLVNLAEERQAQLILRGLRAVSDFEYEFQLAGMNKKLYAKADTIFFTPSEENSYISSSLIREIARYGGNITEFVHPHVRDALNDRLGS